MSHHHAKPLTAAELDIVSGGNVRAEFQVGNLWFDISANATSYTIQTTDLLTGKSASKTTWPHPC